MSENTEVILVDIGNTKIKTAAVIQGEIAKIQSWESLDSLFDTYPDSIPCMICSTRSKDHLPSRSNVTVLSHLIPLPIILDYRTPETLGADRIAAVVGVFELFPKSNSLVIDLGTCMTLDFIDATGVFRGGIISPGLKMRMKAMADYTANLPDVSGEWEKFDRKLLGKTTKECLVSGSMGGMLKEITESIREIEKDFTSLNVILTGGDAHYFESNLKAHIFAGSKIVLTGLYRIWKYQNQ